jgi:hypothetical protein
MSLAAPRCRGLPFTSSSSRRVRTSMPRRLNAGPNGVAALKLLASVHGQRSAFKRACAR